MSNDSRRPKLQAFVDWCDQHITGDEKGQAQIFLDRLFQAFGQKGSLDVGGSPEMRIKKSGEDGGGTSFADYVWKPVVLIEMKKRGVDLSRHYRQAFDYWTRLVPDRPRYVVLCNFDRFDIYDFDRQIDTPVDSVALKDLPDRWGPLAFLFPTNEKPTFDNDREKVTREAADKLATCYRKLAVRKVDPELRQRFILQVLVALFSEDIGLLEKYTVSHLLDECKKPEDSYDILGGLFEAMNRSGGNPGGRYKGVRYFNGGLFANPARVELYEDELNQLRECAKSDWSKVDPHIFGTIFQHSMESEERHAMGAHYTSPIDIMKIVKPTIVDPWEAAIAAAKTDKALLKLLERLGTLRVLDPACGSGNFLYMAYREMRRLEALIRERLHTEFPNAQATFAHVNAKQFFGMDIIPFAIELAKVTMMIARKLTIDEWQISDEADLPLQNLDANFLCGDALITLTPSPRRGEGGGEGRNVPGQNVIDPANDSIQSADESASPVSASPLTPTLSPPGRGSQSYLQTPWPPADVIIGNPPFLGAKRLKPERGADYVNAVRKLYKDVPGMADYCVYWIRRSHDHLPACTKADPFVGRAGLVGTQNIRNNQSRVGGLDHVVATGTIVEAVDNQPWSGEANVHVSIANWIKSQDPAVVPKVKRLWTKVVRRSEKKAKVKGFRVDKAYELEDRECSAISAAISDETDVTSTAELQANCEPQRSFNGQMIGHESFLVTEDEHRNIVRNDPRSAKVMFPYLNGREALSGEGLLDRYVIDFGTRDQLEASKFKGAFEWVRKNVLPDRERKAEEGKDAEGNQRSHHRGFLARWWLLSFGRPELISRIATLQRYICCSLVTKRAIFFFVSPEVRPSNLLQVFAYDDDYTFGVIQSDMHWTWFTAKSSKLKSDYRFGEEIWKTFPWPQSPTKKQIDAVAATGREVRRVRLEALKNTDGGLRAVYRTLELPGKHPLKDAHADLDAAVLAAYGFSAKADLLKQLLDLNHAVAAKEKAGEPVTAPGVPASYGDATKLVSEDCIKP